MYGRRSAPRRSSRASAAQANNGAAATPAPAAGSAAAALASAARAAPEINNNDDGDDGDNDRDVAEVLAGGSTSAGRGSGSGSGSGDGGGGSAGEEDGDGDRNGDGDNNNNNGAAEGGGEVAGRKRGRNNNSSSNNGGASDKNTKSVYPNQESTDRWFTNTHMAMVSILAAVYNDLEERHSTTHGKNPAVDQAVLRSFQRIKDIGQGVTVFTVSRLQTHSLISNTVQLCHRMAADEHTRLAKDYPSEEQVEYDAYDASTDDGGGMSDDGGDDDGKMGGGSRGQKRALEQTGTIGAGVVKEGASQGLGDENNSGGGDGGAGGGGGGDDKATVDPPSGKKPRRAAAAAAAAIAAAAAAGFDYGDSDDDGGGGSTPVASADGDDAAEEGFSNGKGKKGKGKQSAGTSNGSSGSGGDDGAAVKKKDVTVKSKEDVERAVAGCMVRERFHAVVMKLVARAKWASEAVGRPHKDVITRAREVIMAIFIDSFYRRMLSLHKLDTSLTQLDRMIAWADNAEDSVSALESGELGPGLPMSEIGLTNIALTVPE